MLPQCLSLFNSFRRSGVSHVRFSHSTPTSSAHWSTSKLCRRDLAMLFGLIAEQPPEAVVTSPYRPASSQVRSATDSVRFAVEDVCSSQLERQIQPGRRRN